MKNLLKIVLPAVFMLAELPVRAEVRLANIFTDGVVLQREMPMKIWGTGDGGEIVSVTLDD